MKEINIAKVLVGKRKAKGITQDELASYMGVSKASVSKWETGQSYPDVTFLPMLAAYFNISVDALIDYQPQMTSGDIRKLYRHLAADFTEKPFDAVLAECREVVRKYYACFPLLLRMGILLVNHLELVPDAEKSAALLAEAKALFIRVREESGDVTLGRQATFMEAICALSSGDPGSAIDLLDDSVTALMPLETLLAAAYQMKGRTRDAKGVLQFGMFAPAIASLLTRVITKEGYRNMLLRPHFKGHIRHYVLLWFGPTVLLTLSLVVYFLLFPGQFDPELTAMKNALANAAAPGLTTEMMLLVSVLQVMIIGPVVKIIPTMGEELGWRGYLLPKLRTLMSDRKALVLSGVVWGLWHVPVIVMGHNYGTEYWGYPWLGILGMVFFCVVLGIIEGYATIRFKSAIPAAMIHSTVNAGAALPIYLVKEGFNPLLGPTMVGILEPMGIRCRRLPERSISKRPLRPVISTAKRLHASHVAGIKGG